MSWFGANATEKAIGVVDKVVTSGMKIWDNSTLTSQEASELFIRLLAATKSQATSISRRQLLWFVITENALLLILAAYYNHNGMETKLDGLMIIADQLKAGWSLMAAVSFYYITQVTGAGK